MIRLKVTEEPTIRLSVKDDAYRVSSRVSCGQSVTLTGQSISANTAVTIYATSGSNSRAIHVGQLIVQEE